MSKKLRRLWLQRLKIIGLRRYLLRAGIIWRSGCGNQIEIDKCKSATFHRSMVVAHLNGLIFDFHRSFRCIFMLDFLFSFDTSVGTKRIVCPFLSVPSVRLLTLSVISIFEIQFNVISLLFLSQLHFIIKMCSATLTSDWMKGKRDGRKRIKPKEKQ